MSSVFCDDARMTTTTPVQIATAAGLFHGMSDPTRLRILLELLGGERRVTDLVTDVGSSQSNVSNHLACLRGCGLVTDRPAERRQVYYSIAHPELIDLLRASEQLLARTGHEVRLCDHPSTGACGDGCG